MLCKFNSSGLWMRSAVFTVLLCSSSLSTAKGGVTTYFSGPDTSKAVLGTGASIVMPVRNSFLSTLSSFGIEDLESIPGGTLNPTLTFGATGISGTMSGQAGQAGVQTFLLFAVSGNNFLNDYDGGGGPPPVGFHDFILFSEPVTAFGSYITNGGDGDVNSLSFRLENSQLGTNKVVSIAELGPNWSFSNVIFVGLADTDPFDRISFIETNDNDGLLFDDLIAGNVFMVPEPGSSMAIAIATACLARYRRRTQRGPLSDCVTASN